MTLDELYQEEQRLTLMLARIREQIEAAENQMQAKRDAVNASKP